MNDNLIQIIPIFLIALTCLTSYLAWQNPRWFNRFQFNVGAIRYRKQYDRLITSAFLHADWTHLLFNILARDCVCLWYMVIFDTVFWVNFGK